MPCVLFLGSNYSAAEVKRIILNSEQVDIDMVGQFRFLVWRKLYHRYKLSKEGPRGGNRRIRDGNPVPGWCLADDGDEEGEDMPVV